MGGSVRRGPARARARARAAIRRVVASEWADRRRSRRDDTLISARSRRCAPAWTPSFRPASGTTSGSVTPTSCSASRSRAPSAPGRTRCTTPNSRARPKPARSCSSPSTPTCSPTSKACAPHTSTSSRQTSTSPLQRYRLADYEAYFRQIRWELEGQVVSRRASYGQFTYPEPVDHCEVCRWFLHCEAQRRTDDHLSLRRRHLARASARAAFSGDHDAHRAGADASAADVQAVARVEGDATSGCRIRRGCRI